MSPLFSGCSKALPIGGWWVSGKPHPNHTNAVLVLALVLCRPEPWSRNGAPWQALPWCSRVHRFALPFTRPRLSPLGGTLEGIRCSASPQYSSREPERREGDKSLEAVPRRKVDVQNTVQIKRGFGIFTATSEQTFPGVELFCSREPHTLPGVCGFRISKCI